jgi:hypothetical protein
VKLTKAFFDDIRELIVSARVTVARGADLVQVHTNFEIGRRIVAQEQRGKERATYGKEVMRALAARLTGEFGNGFSKRNLEYMRRFYLLYQGRARIAQTASGRLPTRQNVQTVSAQLAGPKILQSLTAQSPSDASPTRSFTLSWSHYVFLLGIKNADERSFYEIEATRLAWTVRELKRQFDSSLYERLALSRDKKGIRKLARDGQMVNRDRTALPCRLSMDWITWLP